MPYSGFRLTVLNPFGRDAEVDYRDGLPAPDTPGHAPVNYHGYAACTRGTYHRDPKLAIETGFPILLVLRRNLRACAKALAMIRRADPQRPVAGILKETGTHQITDLLTKPRQLNRFRELLGQLNGAVAPTEFLLPILRGLRPARPGDTVELIPTPYPLEDERWRLTVPESERQGIVVGTREFDVPSRCHLLSLLALAGQTVPISVMNTDHRRGRQLLTELQTWNPNLRVVSGRRPYPDFVRWLSGHRLIFQFDQSHVPGQIAGDAALARMPCVGGNGFLNRLLFPSCDGTGRSLGELLELTHRILNDSDYSREIVNTCAENARSTVSHTAGRNQLGALFARLVPAGS